MFAILRWHAREATQMWFWVNLSVHAKIVIRQTSLFDWSCNLSVFFFSKLPSSEFQASCYFFICFTGWCLFQILVLERSFGNLMIPTRHGLLSTRLYMWYWSLIFSSHGVILSCYVESLNKFARNYLWLLLSTSSFTLLRRAFLRKFCRSQSFMMFSFVVLLDLQIFGLQ